MAQVKASVEQIRFTDIESYIQKKLANFSGIDGNHSVLDYATLDRLIKRNAYINLWNYLQNFRDQAADKVPDEIVERFGRNKSSQKLNLARWIETAAHEIETVLEADSIAKPIALDISQLSKLQQGDISLKIAGKKIGQLSIVEGIVKIILEKNAPPIEFIGSLSCHSLHIESTKAVYLNADLTVNDTFSFTGPELQQLQTLQVLKQTTIHTDHLTNSGQIQLQGGLDCSVKNMAITEQGAIKIAKGAADKRVLRISEELAVNKNTKLVLEDTVLSANAVNIEGEIVAVDSSLAFKENITCDAGVIQISDSQLNAKSLVSQGDSAFDFKNTKLDFDACQFSGELYFDDVDLTSDRLVLEGKVEVKGGSLLAEQFLGLYTQDKEKIHFADVRIDSAGLTLQRADVDYNNTQIFNNLFFIAEGSSDLKGSKVEASKMQIQPEAKFTLQEKTSILAESVIADGSLDIKSSSIIADRFHAKGKVSLEKSYIKADRFFRSETQLTLNQSVLSSGYANLRGQYEINEAELVVEHLQHADQGVVNNSKVQAQYQYAEAGSSVDFQGEKTSVSVSDGVYAGDVAVKNSDKFTLDHLRQDGGTLSIEKAKPTVKKLMTQQAGALLKAVESDVTLSTGYSLGTVNLSADSSVSAHSLDLAGQSQIENSTLNSDGALRFSGAQHELNSATINTKTLDVAAKTRFKGGRLKASQTLNIAEKGDLTLDQSLQVEANALGVAGRLSLKNTKAKIAERTYVIGAAAELNGERSELTSKKVYATGRIGLESSVMHGQYELLVDNGAKVTASQSGLSTQGEMYFGDISFTGEKVALQAQGLSNYGDVEVDGLTIAADHVSNFNLLDGGSSLGIEADRYVYNAPGARIHGNTTHITTTAFVNILGDVKGADQLNVTSLLGVNGGLMRGFNISNNNVIGLNYGLVAPALPTSFSALTDPMRLLSLGKMIACSVLPQYSATINLAYTAGNIAIPAIYKTFFAKSSAEQPVVSGVPVLTARDRTYLTSLREALPKVVKYAGFVSSAYGLVQMGTGMHQEVTTAVPLDISLSNFGNTLLEHSLNVFAPQYTAQSVIGLNAGLIGSYSVSQSEGVSINAGLVGGHNVMQWSALDSYNYGGIVGSQVNKSGFGSLHNSGKILGSNSLQINQKGNLNNHENASIKGAGVAISAEKINNASQLHLTRGQVKAAEFNQSGSGDTRFNGIAATVDSARIAGTAQFTQSVFKAKSSITLETGGLTDLRTTYMEAQDINMQGQAQLTESTAKADRDLRIGETGDVSASKSALEGHDVTVAGNTYLSHSTMKAIGNLHQLAGKEMIAAHSAVTGENVHLDGEVWLAESIAKADKDLRIGATGDVSASKSALQGHDVTVAGDVYLSHSAMQAAGNLHQMAGKEIIAEHSAVTGASVKMDGQVHLLESIAKADGDLRIGATGNVHANQSALEGHDVTVAGNTYLSHSAMKAAGNLHQLAGKEIAAEHSAVTGKNVHLDGEVRLAESIAKADKDLRIGATGDVSANQSALQGHDVTVAGDTHLSHSVMNAENQFHQLAGKAMTAKQSAVTGASVKLDGEVHLLESIAKADRDLRIGETGDVHTDQSALEGHDVTVEGHAHLMASRMTGEGQVHFSQTSHANLEESSAKGNTVKMDGAAQLKQSEVVADKELDITQSATLTTQDALFKAENITHAGQHQFSGELEFDATQSIKTSELGALRSIKTDEAASVLVLKAESGDLDGKISGEHGVVAIKQLSAAKDFIEGAGAAKDQQFDHSLQVITEQDLTLGNISRQCSLGVTADSIKMAGDYHSDQHDFALTSTAGDVNMSGNVTARNIHADSAQNLTVTGNQHAHQDAVHVAKEKLDYLGANVKADRLSATAAAVRLITKGSQAYSELSEEQKQSAGSGGTLIGRENYVESTVGNVENHGGVMLGTDYAQVIAKNDVVLRHNEKTRQGRFDVEKDFDSAVIRGGKGLNGETPGLLISAEGKLINQASSVGAQGDVVINTRKGMESEAAWHTYVDDKHKEKKSWGRRKEVEHTTTKVHKANFEATEGGIYLNHEEGGLHAVATNFTSRAGTKAFTRDDIELYDLKTVERKNTKKKGFLGLSKSRKNELHEHATPTTLADSGITRLESSEGNVKGRGVKFIGGGDLQISAKKGSVHFDTSVLNHRIKGRSQGLRLESGALEAAKSIAKGDAMGLLRQVDPLVGKVERLLQANSAIESMTAASNVALQAYNTAQTIGAQALADRFGIGSGSVVGLTFTDTKTDHRYQTNGTGSIDRGNVTIEAQDTISMKGMKIDADNMSLAAETVNLGGQRLEASMSAQSKSVGLSASAAGGVPDVSVGYSKSNRKEVDYDQQAVNIKGNLNIHAKEMSLDAVSLQTGSMTGSIERLKIKTRQHESHFHSVSVSGTTSGQVSVSDTTRDAKLTGMASGIQVRDGINDNPLHQLNLGHVYLEGAYIATDGKNNLSAKNVESHTLKDSVTGKSAGFSGNVKQVAGAMAGQSQSDQHTPLPIFSIMRGKEVYRAKQQSTIFGKQGTAPDIQAQLGELAYVNPAQMRQVIRDQNTQFTLDVPTAAWSLPAKARDAINAALAEGPQYTELEQTPAEPQQENQVDCKAERAVAEVSDNAGMAEAPVQKGSNTLERQIIDKSFKALEVGAEWVENMIDYAPAGGIVKGVGTAITFAKHLADQTLDNNPAAFKDAAIDTAGDVAGSLLLPLPWYVDVSVGIMSDAMKPYTEAVERGEVPLTNPAIVEAAYENDRNLVWLAEDMETVHAEAYRVAKGMQGINDRGQHMANLFRYVANLFHNQTAASTESGQKNETDIDLSHNQ